MGGEGEEGEGEEGVTLAFRLARTDATLVQRREAVVGFSDAIEQFFAVSAGLLAALQAVFHCSQVKKGGW